jgi:predicted acyl esterase/alkylhydroperoxidase family enzyme
MRALVHLALAVLGVAWAVSVSARAETVMLPMRDGTKLTTEVHLPAAGGPRFPVVLVRTVYGRKSDQVYKAATSRGMAAVIQDTRGYGDSEGTKMMFDADGWGTKQDGLDTVEWIKKQPWCDGSIGTWGVSALGITQNLLAPTTRDLKAQVIGIAPFDMFSTFVRGGVPQKLLSERYARMMGHEQAFLERRKHRTYDDYWQLLDPGSRAEDITAPAVLVGGWFDLYPQGMIDNFVARQYLGGAGARGNQKLIIGPWEHGVTETVGELKFPDYKFDWVGYSWRFMEHWLQGADNGIMREPAVHYYVLGDCSDPEAPGNQWRTAASWPPFSTVATSYYLAADGRLADKWSTAADAKRTFTFDPANPCPTLGGDDALKHLPLDQRPISSRDDVLTFVTEPLSEPLEVTGAVSVKLYVSSDAPDTDFTARLVDYYPDGRQIVLANGIQRVKFRGGFEKAEPLPPGTIGELAIDCWSTSVIFNRGHKIGLHVSSSNWPRYEVNPNTGEDLPKYTGQNEKGDYLIDPASLRVAHNTVYMDATRASVLILPVRPKPSVKTAAFQPRGARVTNDQPARRPRPTKPRIAPAPKESWNAAQKEILEPLEKADRLWNVFTTIANHPDLYRDWTTFASYILRRSTLPPREREILILRIGWLCHAEYEWAQHVRLGKRAGLTDDDLARIRQGPTAEGLSELDRLLLSATDELHADACVSDATWQALGKHYDTKQMMDVVFTVGEYNLVSMALNSFGVQLDEGLEGFEK